MCGGGSSPSSTTQTITQSVPQYLQTGQTQAINQASNLTGTQYQPYTGQAVANLSPMQQQYMSGVEGQQGSWQPAMSGAQGVMSNVAGGQYSPTVTPSVANTQNITPNTISSGMAQYYDPAISSELGGASAAINQQSQQQIANANQQLGNEGAYGYSGSALQDAQINQNAQLAIGQEAASLLPQAFNEAGTLSNQDIQNQMNAMNANNTANLQSNLQNYEYQQLGAQTGLGEGNLALSGAQGLANSSLQSQQAGYVDTNALGTAGQAQQNQAQSELNFPYQQYLSAQQWPYQTLGSEYSALGTVAPYAGSTSSTAQPYSPLASTIGTALAGTSALNYLTSAHGGRVENKARGGQVVHHLRNGGNALYPPVRRDDGGAIPDNTDPNQPSGIGSWLENAGSNAWNKVENAGDNAWNRIRSLGQQQPDITNTGYTPQTYSNPNNPNDSVSTSDPNAINNYLAQIRRQTQQNGNLAMLNMGAGLMSKGNPHNIGGVGSGLQSGLNANSSQQEQNAVAQHARALGVQTGAQTGQGLAQIQDIISHQNSVIQRMIEANKQAGAGTGSGAMSGAGTNNPTIGGAPTAGSSNSAFMP